MNKLETILPLSRNITRIPLVHRTATRYRLTGLQTASKVHPGALEAVKRGNLARCLSMIVYFVSYFYCQG